MELPQIMKEKKSKLYREKKEIRINRGVLLPGAPNFLTLFANNLILYKKFRKERRYVRNKDIP